jgi:hypothetical protein
MITGHRYMIIETCKGAAFSLSARDISPAVMDVNQLMNLLLKVHILFYGSPDNPNCTFLTTIFSTF